MCLHVSKDVKVRVRDGYVLGYKIVYKKTNRSPYKNTTYKKDTIVHGYLEKKAGQTRKNKVKKQLSSLETETEFINYGIHVYLNKKEAYRGLFDRLKVIRVLGHINDLRAVGYNNGSTRGAVFTKVKVID